MAAAELHQYFDAEQQAAVLIGSLGVASLCLASYVWFARSPFKAMAWPLVIIGVIEVGIGVGLLLRTGPQVALLERGMTEAPRATVTAERARMNRVNRSFRIIKIAEVVVIAVGVVLAMFLPTANLTWSAVGMGLLLQAAVLLVFDLFAAHRAHVYTRWLSSVLGS